MKKRNLLLINTKNSRKGIHQPTPRIWLRKGINNFIKTMFLKKIISKIKGIDEFYLGLDIKRITLYQKYFSQMINSVDIHNLTERSLGRNYDQQKIDFDYDKIENVLNEAEKNNLKSIYLEVMFEQYIYADVYQREMHNDSWVQKVMKRQSIDFFPSPGGILHILYPDK